jgi:hypothetical protein
VLWSLGAYSPDELNPKGGKWFNYGVLAQTYADCANVGPVRLLSRKTGQNMSVIAASQFAVFSGLSSNALG